jgi:hypothetical protein
MKLSQHASVRMSLFAIGLAALTACAAVANEDAGTGSEKLESASSSSGSTGQPCVALNGKADVRCTPGAFNPAVTQATIQTTICVSGWTSTIRPPSSYTTAMKNQQKPEYGESAIANADLEEDHLVPLELGGNPHDANNLWPEPRQSVAPPGQGAETKDGEETTLKQKVCAGQMTLDAARQKILADWTH